MKVLPVLLLALAVGVTSCRRNFFHADGTVASEGNHSNTWRSTPHGCTRDPFDGLPPDRSNSILTLLWEDPGMRDPLLDNRDTAPDAPIRLEFSRPKVARSPTVATLRTLRHPGIQLDNKVCALFQLYTEEHAPASAQALTSLSGALAFDCRVDGNRIIASVNFEHCTY